MIVDRIKTGDTLFKVTGYFQATYRPRCCNPDGDWEISGPVHGHVFRVPAWLASGDKVKCVATVRQGRVGDAVFERCISKLEKYKCPDTTLNAPAVAPSSSESSASANP